MIFSQINIWVLIAGILPLAVIAIIRAFVNLKNQRLDDGLALLGLYVALGFIILSLFASVEDNAQANHRHNCVMYEFALQRNADPDLPDVEIDPAWHELECYPDP